MHGVTLNHELRQQLRAAIDHARRQQLHALENTCRACGTETENRTLGCRACNDRHRARARRQDPVFRQEQNYLRALRHHRRRQETTA